MVSPAAVAISAAGRIVFLSSRRVAGAESAKPRAKAAGVTGTGVEHLRPTAQPGPSAFPING
jgi:hypothetical protein